MADAVHDELLAAAEVLNTRHKATTGIEVRVQRRSRGLLRVDGLCAWDRWTYVFEPVRQRPLWSSYWRVRQAPADAAEKMEWVFANRPDLPPNERPEDGETRR